MEISPFDGPDMNAVPIVLEGAHVRLEPLSFLHESDLFLAGRPVEIWDFMPFGPFRDLGEIHVWIAECLQQVSRGEKVWFACVRRSDNRAVGATSYMDIRRQDRGLEIGGTWLTPKVWRTAINTEAKYLLLRNAFETLGCIRVQLKTDLRNVRSQKAIERLGAQREGVLRKHMIVKDGFQRSTVMYSITDSEWPAVKTSLETRLNRTASDREGNS